MQAIWKVNMKSGFISIIGKTNAGKSTLINLITKNKISICTPKPQTTRNSIQGIYNDKDSQIVFIDTPGFLSPHQKLDEYMNKQAFSSLNGIDGVILLVDAGVPFNKEKDSVIQKNLKTLDVPLFIVFNKIDLTNIYLVNNLKKEYLQMFPNSQIIEISAMKDVNVDLLLNKIKDILPEGFKFYPDDIKSDHPVSFLISEIIREKILLFTRDEVPHSCAVKVEKMVKNNNSISINATIICERSSQKVIIIGKQGSMLKRIGIAARKDIEKLLNKKINLETFVRVEERWRNNETYLKEFGYKDE